METQSRHARSSRNNIRFWEEVSPNLWIHGWIDDESSYTARVCPGKHMGLASFQMNVASLLHSFNITPPLDDNGHVVNLEIEYVSGLLKYVVFSIFLQSEFDLFISQHIVVLCPLNVPLSLDPRNILLLYVGDCLRFNETWYVLTDYVSNNSRYICHSLSLS